MLFLFVTVFVVVTLNASLNFFLFMLKQQDYLHNQYFHTRFKSNNFICYTDTGSYSEFVHDYVIKGTRLGHKVAFGSSATHHRPT